MTIHAPPPIARRLLHHEAADRLRAEILEGVFEPKAKLAEIELAERYGISRTPMREALRLLAAEGYVELLPNRGARVASVTTAEIDEMLEVVAGLEATAGELAARDASEKEIAAIAGLHEAMVAAYERRDDGEYFRLNRAIHEAIVAASHNATLVGLYRTLSTRVQRMRYTAHKTEAQWARAIAEHVDMVEFLRARRGEELARLMKSHVRGKKAVVAAAYGG